MTEESIKVSKLPGKLGEKANSIRLSGESIESEVNVGMGSGILLTRERIIFVFAGLVTSHLKSSGYYFADLQEIQLLEPKGKFVLELNVKFTDISIPPLSIDVDKYDSKAREAQDFLECLRHKSGQITVKIDINNALQLSTMINNQLPNPESKFSIEPTQNLEQTVIASSLPGKLGEIANNFRLPRELIEAEINISTGTGLLLTEERIMFIFAGWITSHLKSICYSLEELEEIHLIGEESDNVYQMHVKLINESTPILSVNVSNQGTILSQTKDLLRKIKHKSNHINIKIDVNNVLNIVNIKNNLSTYLQSSYKIDNLEKLEENISTSAVLLELGTIWEFTVAGGYGHNLIDRHAVAMVMIKDKLHIATSTKDAYIEIHIDEIVDVVIGGPGEIVSGGGFTGGGFGLSGAVKGIVTASILNAITTNKSITTTIQITTVDSEYIFISNQIVPEQMSIVMSPILGRLRSRAKSIPVAQQGSADIVSLLTNLANLHQSGALSDDEFRAAKVKLLT